MKLNLQGPHVHNVWNQVWNPLHPLLPLRNLVEDQVMDQVRNLIPVLIQDLILNQVTELTAREMDQILNQVENSL